MSELLDPKEIDALLSAVEKGELDQPEVAAEDKPKDEAAQKVTPYDITNPDITLKGRMPLMHMINERFCRLFRNSLSSILQRVCDVELAETRGIRFGEFLAALPLPACISLMDLDPLEGSGLLILDSHLIFVAVDLFCGGSGKDSYKVQSREFTPIEMRLAQRLIAQVIEDLKEAWSSVQEVDFSLVRMETNPQFVSVIPPEEVIMVAEFRIDVEGSVGKMVLAIPYFSLEPLRTVLGREYMRELRQPNDQWRGVLEQELMRAKVELRPILGHATLSVRELCDLEVGDVIQLDTWADGLIPMYVEGRPKFFVRPGRSGAYRAVKIEDYITEH
ncbi:MAG TPA: flagellar motor switch protein FliM [Proteobacteria bacterium]|nr:flagellar motor switch protein FliM [Pseudomonadota bacterium]